MEFRHALIETKKSMLTYMFLLFDQINCHAHMTKYLKRLRTKEFRGIIFSVSDCTWY